MMMMMMMVMMMLKLMYCRRAYDHLRILFNEMCGNMVDAGNAIWLGLLMYFGAAIMMFFFSLQLLHAVRTDDTRIRPRRVAVIVDLDRSTPTESDTTMMEAAGDWKRGQPAADDSWKRGSTGYRMPGKTHGDWLQDTAERERRRNIVA